MFTEWQTSALDAPLPASAIKQRKQGGAQVSYIEGWHAIAEANRIFGFDGWTRETTETRLVSERERKIGQGQYQKDGWGATYIAKVRVTVFAGDTLITREGCGAGHGIDVDLGQAHESAVKEAETDAMKRALMTFGNVFGLALYDKERRNVGEAEPSAPKQSARNQDDTTAKMIEAVNHAATYEALQTLINGERWKAGVAKIPDADKERLRTLVKTRMHALSQSPFGEAAE